jgi:hypothetical protein
MRATQPGFWIQCVADSVSESSGDIVISDVRYANEAEWIYSACGTVIRITRDGYGPANEEEARSFEEIGNRFPHMWRVHNLEGDPQHGVREVLRWLR